MPDDIDIMALVEALSSAAIAWVEEPSNATCADLDIAAEAYGRAIVALRAAQ